MDKTEWILIGLAVFYGFILFWGWCIVASGAVPDRAPKPAMHPTVVRDNEGAA